MFATCLQQCLVGPINTATAGLLGYNYRQTTVLPRQRTRPRERQESRYRYGLEMSRYWKRAGSGLHLAQREFHAQVSGSANAGEMSAGAIAFSPIRISNSWTNLVSRRPHYVDETQYEKFDTVHPSAAPLFQHLEVGSPQAEPPCVSKEGSQIQVALKWSPVGLETLY